MAVYACRINEAKLGGGWERGWKKRRDRGRSRLRIENVSRKEAVTVIEGPWFDNLSPRLVPGDPRCNSRHSKGPVGLDQPFILLQ